MPLPMPRLAPVTTATLPAREGRLRMTLIYKFLDVAFSVRFRPRERETSATSFMLTKTAAAEDDLSGEPSGLSDEAAINPMSSGMQVRPSGDTALANLHAGDR